MRGFFRNPYYVFLTIIFMIFSMSIFHSQGVSTTLDGIVEIFKSPDILVTDYIELAGLSSAFLNSAIMGFFSIILLLITKHELDEKTISILWLICGFSFFGKNLANILPIVLGGYLYSLYVKEKFKENVVYALFGTGLAPAVSQVYYINAGIPWFGVILGVLLGIFIGFCIIPISKSTAAFQGKYNLYNTGFSGGIFAMLIMAVFRALGYDFNTVNVWSSGNNHKIIVLLVAISIFLIIAGIFSADDYKERTKSVTDKIISGEEHVNHSYNMVKDYVYINMGILGLFSSILMIILGVELSGPVIGGIFTIIGFGSCGKNLRSITPVMVGATIAGLVSFSGDLPSNTIIAILFSTCLAPIANKFGALWGIIAGIFHVTIVMNSGNMYGGMNLYNNGLAGGLAVIILVPIITTIKHRPLKVLILKTEKKEIEE